MSARTVWVIMTGVFNESGDIYNIYDDRDFALEEFMKEHGNHPRAKPVEHLSDGSAHFCSGIEWFNLYPRNVITRSSR